MIHSFRFVLLSLVLTLGLTACERGQEAGGQGPAAEAGVDVSPHTQSSAPRGKPALVATIAFEGNPQLLPEDAKVFAYLRKVGERMPLAVETFTLLELPVQMAFGRPEEEAGEVEVVARISMTGAVNKHPGDLELISEPFILTDQRQDVTLTLRAATAEDMAGVDAGERVRTQVSFAVPQPQQYAQAQVYVTAHAADGTLGNMPVAVRKISPNVLPAVVELSDLNGMVSLVKLSQQEQVKVKARLSLNGSAIPGEGDWYSNTLTVAVGDGELHELQLQPPGG